MLSKFDSEKQHLIQIILVGQLKLQEKLQRIDLEQFTQCVSLHSHLGQLEEDEVGPYIRHRLKVGGAANFDIFDPEAIQAVSIYSKGNPRILNILCNTALVFGYAHSAEVIDKEIIEKVIKEREDDAIFAATRPNKKKALALSSKITARGEPAGKSLRSIDKRMRRIESILDRIEQHLHKLAGE
jgi:general secretion pathway protein A